AQHQAGISRNPTVLFVYEANGEQIVADQTIDRFPNCSAIFAGDNSSAIANGNRALLRNQRDTGKWKIAEANAFFPMLAAVAGAQDGPAIADSHAEIFVGE